MGNKSKFYAVVKGRSPGLYKTWEECQKQISGFKGAVFKSFTSEADAKSFMKAGSYEAYKNLTATTSGGATAAAAGSNGVKSGSRSYSTSTKSTSTKTTAAAKRPKIEDRGLGVSSLMMTVIGFFFKPEDDGNCPPSKRPRNDSLTRNDEGFVVVYTDGACPANGRAKARAGLGVFWAADHRWNVAEPVSGTNVTNNAGEIQAVTAAVRIARREGLEKLCVRTDSKFTIDCVTKWMDGWKRNGWKKADKKDVKNKTDLLQLDEALQNTPDSVVRVKFEHVRGHCGIFGNEMADRLANEGARKHPGIAS